MLAVCKDLSVVSPVRRDLSVVSPVRRDLSVVSPVWRDVSVVSPVRRDLSDADRGRTCAIARIFRIVRAHFERVVAMNLLGILRAVIAAGVFAGMSAAVMAENLSIQRLYAEPALGGTPPIAMRLSPDGSRVAFLQGKKENSQQLDLWSFDIKSKRTSLLVDSNTITGGKEVLSDEERARRERMRMASVSGIAEYFFSSDGQSLLFPLSGNLYLYELKSAKVQQLTDAKDGAISNPKFSPKDRYVSFVRGQNLYAIELKTKRLIALSEGGGGLKSFGMAEFVAQEEMARFTGYWWAPDDSKIAMQSVDESTVAVEKRFEIYADRTEIIEQRYPAAGKANAVVELFVVDVQAPKSPQKLDLGSNADIYLARVDWLPDSKRVAVQRQSRDQQVLDLIFFDAADGAAQKILTQTSDSFVNLSYDLRFLKKRPEFIFSSEASGFKHLYRYDLNGKQLAQMTRGEWQVDALLAVDEGKQLAYFSGNVSDPIQQHVYVVDLAGNSPPKALTKMAGTHVASFTENAAYFLDSYSDLLTPAQVRLHDAKGVEVAVLNANEVKAGHALFPYKESLVEPSYGVINAKPSALQYRLYKPKDFDASKRYPVLVFTYGGPHVQVLQRKFGDLLPQVWLAQGYLVFSVDNRGSARRGKAFESAIYRQMGAPDVADQLAGIRWLHEQPFVDNKRIGVHGWSYGGYMSLHILAQGGDLIRAGAAGAPVTDWSLYDTHYTERYMATPQNNAEGYKNSSVLTHLDGLKARLLLIHGMADDNVLFTNSTSLMSALQDRGVGFDLMTYPGMKHGPANPKTRTHVYSGIEAFFRRELLER
jgi:dipeptidyl-peptidase 4